MSARALVQAAPSDGELARAAQAGDVASLGHLLERHRAPLHAAALRFVGHGSAEDAVQETFVIALRRIADVRDPDAIGGWLHAVLRNVCLMSVRRDRSVEPRESLLRSGRHGPQPPERGEAPAGGGAACERRPRARRGATGARTGRRALR